MSVNSSLENRMNTRAMAAKADSDLATILEEIRASRVENKEIQDAIKKSDESVTNFTTEFQNMKDDFKNSNNVNKNNQGLMEQLLTANGKISRLEKRNHDLEEKVLELESQQYQQDLMFYHINDNQHERPLALKAEIYRIIREDMKVPENYIFSATNPTGEVRIDTATRYGGFTIIRRGL